MGNSLMADDIPGKYWDMYKKPKINGSFELSVFLDAAVPFPNALNRNTFLVGPGLDIKGTWNINNFKLGFQIAGFGFGPSIDIESSDYFVHTSLAFIFGYKFHIYGLFSIAPYLGFGATIYTPGTALAGFTQFGSINLQPFARVAIDFIFRINNFFDILFTMGSSVTMEISSENPPSILGMGHFGIGVIMKF